MMQLLFGFVPALAVGLGSASSQLQAGSEQVHPAAPFALQQVLMAPVPALGDHFGMALAMSGDTLAVGAGRPYAQTGHDGGVYLFERSAGSWVFQRHLAPPEPAVGKYRGSFGLAVALDGDTLVVGRPDWSDLAGAAYVFERDLGGADNWGLARTHHGVWSAELGTSVTIDDDTLAIGSPDWCDGDICLPSENVIVCERDAGGPNNWGIVQTVRGTFGYCDDFGESIALQGERLIVGAPTLAYFCGIREGSTYIHGRDIGGPSAWGRVLEIAPTPGLQAQGFGRSVAQSGNTIATHGLRQHIPFRWTDVIEMRDKNAGGPGMWGLVAEVSDPDPGFSSYPFGSALALAGDFLIVGEPEDGVASESGAWIFERHRGGENAWGQRALLRSPMPLAGDRFGYSIAAEGTTIAVGAPFVGAIPLLPGTVYIHTQRPLRPQATATKR